VVHAPLEWAMTLLVLLLGVVVLVASLRSRHTEQWHHRL
jgi:hypothetical protein